MWSRLAHRCANRTGKFSSQHLGKLFQLHGGSASPNLSKKTVTHIVLTSLAGSKTEVCDVKVFSRSRHRSLIKHRRKKTLPRCRRCSAAAAGPGSRSTCGPSGSWSRCARGGACPRASTSCSPRAPRCAALRSPRSRPRRPVEIQRCNVSASGAVALNRQQATRPLSPWSSTQACATARPGTYPSWMGLTRTRPPSNQRHHHHRLRPVS